MLNPPDTIRSVSKIQQVGNSMSKSDMSNDRPDSIRCDPFTWQMRSVLFVAVTFVIPLGARFSTPRSSNKSVRGHK
jgi:hypothetical protein